jgi:hypothetical protein
MISQKEFDDAMNDLVKAEAEIEQLRAALAQVRAFAKMMSKDNWRDLSLRIQRQGVDGQSTQDADLPTAADVRGILK